jgi:hypothetical protein
MKLFVTNSYLLWLVPMVGRLRTDWHPFPVEVEMLPVSERMYS